MLPKSRSTVLLLLAMLAATPVYPHAGEDAPAFVAENGVDNGLCRDAAAPCRTIGYALEQLGKGAALWLAAGQYVVTDRDELFHLLNGAIEIRNGYDAASNFQELSANTTVLSGVPGEFADALRKRGFGVITDNMAVDRATVRKLAADLELHQALASSMSVAPCVGGSANGLPCQNIDLLSHVGFGDISANPRAGADVWGFVDLNSGREYAIVGFDIGTAVFDVTDAANPREVGFVDGQATVWRDIKVYQFWDSLAARWHAVAYITADGASDGLFVLDMGDLPHAIRRVSYGSDFSRAHNVYTTGTDFGTGLALGAATPSLVIAGSGNNSGQYRAYTLTNALAPAFEAMPGSGASDYMHDAASMIITDARKDTQCANAGAWCELLFDFNESTFDIWDISNATSPVRLSRTGYSNARYVHSGWWSEDKQYLFVQDELDERNVGLNTTLRVFDLSNLRAPAPAATWTGPTGAIDHNGFVRGNRYYMSNYSRGVTILDISNITNIQTIAYLDTFPGSDSSNFVGAWGVYPFFHSGNIAVSDIDSGFYMVADRSLDVAAGRLEFSAPAFGADEGQQLQIPVARRFAASGSVSVAYEVLPATGSSADVAGGSGILNWGNGDSADKLITLDATGDADTGEGLERLFLRLFAPSGGATLGPQNLASIYVSEAGAAATVAFADSQVRTAERGFATAVAVLQRSGSALGAVSVDYAITDGDATAGVDFLGSTSGTVSWGDGDADPKWLEFAIVDDGSGEAEEFFELTLANASGAAIAAPASLRVILADGTGINNAPHAVAGASQTVNAGASVTLDGSASSDPEGDTLSYQWLQTSGTAVSIANAGSAIATFTAPSANSDQLLQFTLTVADGVNADVASTSVTVRRTGGGGNKKGGGAPDWLLLMMLAAAALRRWR